MAAVVFVWSAISFILGLAVLYDLLWRGKGRSKLKLPPGPPGLPLLGNLGIFFGSKLHHATLGQLTKRYGGITFLRLGSSPCIVVSSPEVCKEIFKNQDQAFASRRLTQAESILMYDGKNVAFAPYGEYWRSARKTVVTELLTQKKIQDFEQFRTQETSALVTSLYQNAVHGKGAAMKMRTSLKALTFNVSTCMCFNRRFFQYQSAGAGGSEVPEDANDVIDVAEAKEFTELIEEAFFLLGAQFIGDFLPYLSFLDRFSRLRSKIIRIGGRFDDLLQKIIQDRRSKHPLKEDESPSFVDVLINLDDGMGSMDDFKIKAMCVDILFGATETTSTVLEWGITEIIRSPAIHAKMQAELDAVVGKDRVVTEADIPQLPYLQAVVKELLRLHPPIGFLPHMTTQHTNLMGYDIPVDTIVFIAIWGIARDPAVWDNPLEFRPERFVEKPEIDVRGQNFELLPFGTGRRGCIGIGLGVTMVQYSLARLVQAFDWSPPPGVKPQDVSVEEAMGLSIPRAQPVEAVLTPRLSTQLY